MIGIRALGQSIASHTISNLDRAKISGKDEDFIRDKIGFVSVARATPETQASDLCVAAFEDLCKRTTVRANQLDCVVVCTQNPDGKGLPHTSAIVHKKLGFPKGVACFDISLGCSGYVYGLSIILGFMQANGMQNGLLFTADPYSRILDHKDWNTELLFGDAATCTWISSNPIYRIRPPMFGTDGNLGHSIQIDPVAGTLSMLGSNVFKFCMTVVPQQIIAYLTRESLSINDIDIFLFHQGSRFIVESLAKKLGLPPAKVPFEATHTGNTVSSSLPLLLLSRLNDRPARILLSGFGVGLSWATMILDNNQEISDET